MRTGRLLCDDIVSKMNAKEDWSLTFTAERKSSFRYLPKDIRELQVNLLPEQVQSQLLGRSNGVAQASLKVTLLVMQRVDKATNDQVDPLHDLLDEIESWLRQSVMFQAGSLKFAVKTTDQGYRPDYLSEDRIYLGAIVVEFGGGRT